LREEHDRDWIYSYFEHQFFFVVPDYVRKHRNYFAKKSRGFGEPAFHALWYQIIIERRPSRMLEIGVYRGQILSLWNLIAKKEQISVEVWGVTPMTDIGDEVSQYSKIDYEKDIARHFEFWNLEKEKIKGVLSTSLEGEEFISSSEWDVIYIDGGHDFETVTSDWRSSLRSISREGIIALDDSSLFTNLSVEHRGFRGHPGPSELLTSILKNDNYFVLGVGHLNLVMKYELFLSISGWENEGGFG
jgi:hypothetical protein